MFGYLCWTVLVLSSYGMGCVQAQVANHPTLVSSAIAILAGNGIYGPVYFNITSTEATTSGTNNSSNNNNNNNNNNNTTTPSAMLISGRVHIDQENTGDYVLHVHDNPVADDGDCGSTGSHLNPIHVDAKDCYKDGNLDACACRPGGPIDLCEVGNLSGKWGSLKRQSNGTISFNWRDSALALSGKAGVIGRAVVMHKADMTMVACGSIFAVLANGTVYNNTISNSGSSRLYHQQPTWMTISILIGFFGMVTIAQAI